MGRDGGICPYGRITSVLSLGGGQSVYPFNTAYSSEILVSDSSKIPLDALNVTTSIEGSTMRLTWEAPPSQLAGVHYRVVRVVGDFFKYDWWGKERYCRRENYGIDLPVGVTEWATPYAPSQSWGSNLSPFYSNWNYLFRVCAVNKEGSAFSRGSYKWLMNPLSTFVPPVLP